MTTEIEILSPHSFHPPLLVHACTQHTNPHPPHTHTPHVPKWRTLRSFGFFHVWPGLVPPTWPLDPVSIYRHPFIYILFSSRFTSYNKNKTLITHLSFGLSLHRHAYISIFFSSRFVSYNKRRSSPKKTLKEKFEMKHGNVKNQPTCHVTTKVSGGRGETRARTRS
jgi:hypothetical protein